MLKFKMADERQVVGCLDSLRVQINTAARTCSVYAESEGGRDLAAMLRDMAAKIEAVLETGSLPQQASAQANTQRPKVGHFQKKGGHQ